MLYWKIWRDIQITVTRQWGDPLDRPGCRAHELKSVAAQLILWLVQDPDTKYRNCLTTKGIWRDLFFSKIFLYALPQRGLASLPLMPTGSTRNLMPISSLWVDTVSYAGTFGGNKSSHICWGSRLEDVGSPGLCVKSVIVSFRNQGREKHNGRIAGIVLADGRVCEAFS